MAAHARAPKTLSPAELVERIRKDLDVAELRLSQCLRAQAEFAERSITDPSAVKDYEEACHSVGLVRSEISRFKIALAGAEERARQAEAERIARDQAAHIARVVALLEKRDQAGAELAEHLAAADKAFRRVLELGNAVAAGWPFSGSDQQVAVLAANRVVQAVQLELWRIGGRPFTGGGPGKPDPSFPGGRCDDHRLRGQVDRLPTLAQALAVATNYAVEIMKGQRPSTPALAIGTQVSERILTDAEVKLGALLKEQAALANDVTPEGERKYAAVVAEIATAQAEIDATKGVGA
jgi:hypothetical protein